LADQSADGLTGPVSMRVAAGVLQDAAGRVLIARRPDHKHAGGFWEFPGGKFQAGETGSAALARELEEELGIQVEETQPLVSYAHEYPGRVVSLEIFRVLRWTGVPEGREGQPLRWVAVADLLEAGLLPADRPVVAALSTPED
jgi:8-oxo-dGTP diphosphatase